MHATDTILFSCLRLIMKKARVKFHPDLNSSFGEKVEQTRRQTRRQTDVDKYYIDSGMHL